MSAEFVACMEDVLELYAEPYDPKCPVVCFDETPKQLVAEKRSPIPTKAGGGNGSIMNINAMEHASCSWVCEPLPG